VTSDHEQRPECREDFARIWKRLDAGDSRFARNEEEIHRQDVESAELRRDMSHLTKSMDGLTKALWGVVVSFLLLGAGFVIWYIQSIPR